MMTRPLKVEEPCRGALAPPPRAQTPALYEGDYDLGLATFCRGAGVDPRTITPEARGGALQLAGQLLREAVLGLMDLNQGRNEFRNRFRISAPPQDGPESPLNLSQGVDEALVRLLTTVSTRAGSVDAIRDNFRELKAQNAASFAAMRAAFEEFLGRVDPKELEERFERATKRGVFGTQNKAQVLGAVRRDVRRPRAAPGRGIPASVHREPLRRPMRPKLRAVDSAAAHRRSPPIAASRAIRGAGGRRTVAWPRPERLAGRAALSR